MKSRHIKLAAAVLSGGVLVGLGAVATANDGRTQVDESLSGYQETPPLSTNGVGEFHAAINQSGKAIRYRLTFKNLGSDVTQAHLHFENRTEAGDAEVLADPEKLQQILLNLLSNAVKFTPQGGRITLDCRNTERSMETTVQDTGVGIPADRLDVIFDPFVQLQTGLTRSTEGSGLGLAISRDLARGMQGDLRVRSTVGEGSVFTVEIPLA